MRWAGSVSVDLFAYPGAREPVAAPSRPEPSLKEAQAPAPVDTRAGAPGSLFLNRFWGSS